jgi:hypothetical protein
MKPLLIILFLSFNFAVLFINCRSYTAEISHAEVKPDVYASVTPTVTPQDGETAKLNKAGNKSSIISCRDEELAPIWKILADDKDVKELVIESDSGGDCSDYVSVAKKIDLNDDGIVEFFVEGNGNFGNVSTVPIWVVGKDGNDFKVLLREQGEEYKIKPTRTNGYQDLFFPSRRNIRSAFLSTYKFSDEKYEISQCQVAFYHKSDKPLKVFNCNQQKEIEKFESDYKFEN